jgi:HEAT repeat protein
LATPEILEELEPVSKRSTGALSNAEKKKAVRELESLLGRDEQEAASRREELLKTIGEDAVPSLLVALESKDPVVRRTSVVLLGSVFSDRVAAAFGKLARDPNPRVRLAAAWILEHEATIRAMRALENFLLDVEEEIRLSAFSGMGYAGVSQSFPVVALGLKDISPRVRAAAARSLGFFGNPEAVPDIEIALEREKDRSVQRELMLACGRIVSESSLRVLAWGLSSANAVLREAAVEALGMQGAAAFPLLLAGMEHPEEYVRWLCAEELRRQTGKSFNYKHDAPGNERKAALLRWRQFLGLPVKDGIKRSGDSASAPGK